MLRFLCPSRLLLDWFSNHCQMVKNLQLQDSSSTQMFFHRLSSNKDFQTLTADAGGRRCSHQPAAIWTRFQPHVGVSSENQKVSKLNKVTWTPNWKHTDRRRDRGPGAFWPSRWCESVKMKVGGGCSLRWWWGLRWMHVMPLHWGRLQGRMEESEEVQELHNRFLTHSESEPLREEDRGFIWNQQRSGS